MQRTSIAERLLAGVIVVALLAAIYALLASAGLVPAPRSVASLEAKQQIGRGMVLTAGYYISQPFTSIGVGLPPYTLAASTASGSPKVFVKPSLPDVRAGRVVVLVDTATGDGSEWSPLVVQTVTSTPAFAAALILVLALAVLAASWLYGAVRWAARSKSARVVSRT